MSTELNELLQLAQVDGRICPMPQQWNKLHELLPDKKRIGNGWHPPVPLILAAWDHSTDFEKRMRFHDHLKWAVDHGAAETVNAFLAGLAADDWYRG